MEGRDGYEIGFENFIRMHLRSGYFLFDRYGDGVDLMIGDV